MNKMKKINKINGVAVPPTDHCPLITDHCGFATAAKPQYLSFPLITGESVYFRATGFQRDIFADLRSIMNLPDTPGTILAGNIRPLEESNPSDDCWFPKSGLFRMKPYRPDGELSIFIPEEIPATGKMTVHQSHAFIARRMFFFLIFRLMLEQKLFIMHGGMCLTPNGKALIFSGPSGVGKSTAVTKAGKCWEILADDCLYLSRLDNKFYAQPGATWSTYFTEKERLTQCNSSRFVEIGEIIMLNRRQEEPHVEKINWQQSMLSLTGSLIRNLEFQAELLPDNTLRNSLRCAAFAGMTELVKIVPAYRLFSKLETDIIPILEPCLQ